MTAAVLSWVQVALLVVLVAGLDGGDPDRTSVLRAAIDRVDGVKLVTLAVPAVAATVAARRAGLGPRWLALVARALAPLLLAGAISFVVTSPLLTATLYVGLPLLLLVVGGTGIAAWRRARCRRVDGPRRSSGSTGGGQASRRRSDTGTAIRGTRA
ncbi:hypothetical protein [Geodermatophilus sp. SYSU D01119]